MTKQSTNTQQQSLCALIADDQYVAGFQTVGQYRAALLQQATAPDALEGYLLMPERLTAENGAKGALSCEFHETIDIECPECNGDGKDAHGEDCPECDGTGKAEQRITVEWDTIKRIYAKAVEICGHSQFATSATPSALGTSEAPLEKIGIGYIDV
jgi:hypothetical protein